MSNQTGFVPEPRDGGRIQGGTLDRRNYSAGGGRYPLYHTCNRINNKKKVTILENEVGTDQAGGSKV